jgi:hypothetical protein
MGVLDEMTLVEGVARVSSKGVVVVEWQAVLQLQMVHRTRARKAVVLRVAVMSMLLTRVLVQKTASVPAMVLLDDNQAEGR